MKLFALLLAFTLPSSGPISLNDITTEFGLPSNATFPGAFYGLGGAPSSGALSLQDFYGRSAYIAPSVSIGGAPAQSDVSWNAPSPVTSSGVTCVVSHGAGPFSYSWSIAGSGWTISSPNSPSTDFSHAVTIGTTQSTTATCTATDARGNSASGSTGVSLTRDSKN
jgi:hypothetical protein